MEVVRGVRLKDTALDPAVWLDGLARGFWVWVCGEDGAVDQDWEGRVGDVGGGGEVIGLRVGGGHGGDIDGDTVG